MNTRYIFLLLACFLSALLGVGATLWFVRASEFLPPLPPAPAPPERPATYAPTQRDNVAPITPPAASKTPAATGFPASFTSAARAVTPAVVFVRNYRERALGGGSSTGSGVLISADGLIATNNHVIDGADRLRVTLNDRREYDARVVGTDASTDLALLRIEGRNFPSLPFADSDSLQVGEWVLAIGNPFNLNSTVTAGIVSAKGRSIDVLEPEDRIESFIQTDAAVNPGNSGGALVNTAGQLVGINTAIITGSGKHEGFAFAVPGNLVRRVLNDLRDFGEVKRAVLGVYIQGVNDAQARKLELDRARGALITKLTPAGPAERAGLQVGDVLVSLNGTAINSAPQMQEQLSRYRPGDRLPIRYIRAGRERELTVELTDKENRVRALVSKRDDPLPRLGLDVEQTGAGLEVTAVRPSSVAAQVNLVPGFLIEKVNGRAVRSLTELIEALVEAEGAPLLSGTYAGYPDEYFYELR